MKKVITVLAMMGATCFANAQTKKITTADNNKGCLAVKQVKHHRTKRTAMVYTAPRPLTVTKQTYQVCTEEGGYYTCCLHENTSFLK